MTARDFRRLSQPAGRLWNHSGSALDKRLYDKRSVRISSFPLRFELLFQFADAFPMAFPVSPRVGPFRFGAIERAAVAVRSHYAVRFE
jgi:hypothetical protein